MGKKPSDKYCTPLCDQHHKEQHARGEKTFWGDTDLAKTLAERLFEYSGKRAAAIAFISGYRGGLFQ